MVTKKSSSSHTGAIVGLAALATAAAAGAYFLTGKNGKNNRQKVKGWMLKAKGEVLDQLEKMKLVSEEAYHATVEKVAAKYKTLKNIDPKEIEGLVKELKGHWRSITRDLGSKKRPTAKRKKVTKKKSA